MSQPDTSLAPPAQPPGGPLFQKPPETPEELEANKPVALGPEVVQELDEDGWYEKVYRGERAAQLTVRAVLMGSVLGFFLAFTNLYVGLKAGWHLGVSITASILSFTIWGFFIRVGLVKSPMTILENNCMQSTASSAGYSTGGTMVSAIPALFMLSVTSDAPGGQHLPWYVLAPWTAFIALLGATLAIPMKRNMINQERLRFPTGTAAAVTLQSLYSKGEDALVKGRALLTAAAVAGVVPLLKDLELFKIKALHPLGLAIAGDAAGKLSRHALIPGESPIFDWIGNLFGGIHAAGKVYKPSDFRVQLDHGVVLIAAGALVGLRVTLSMVAGGLFVALVLGPIGMETTWVNPLGVTVAAVSRPARAVSEVGLWLGAPILVSAGLLSFAMQWRTIGRAFKGIGGGKAEGAKAGVEVPGTWFVAGGLVATVGIVSIAWRFFNVPPHLGVLAVALTFVLSLVAARATGETDVTPTGAMGKIMQLIYGVLIPQSATANLMTAGITAGSASAGADLLTDLKSGYLLGANPRRQFIAQIMGILPGTVATVLGFYALVPTTAVIMGDHAKFDAPAAQQWRAVAEVFKVGIGNLHPMARSAIFYGLAIGAVLVVIEKLLPKAKKYLPSPTGFGLGCILAFNSSFAMFLGALIAWLVEQRAGKSGKATEMIVPIASGIIAGESIIGVIVQILNVWVLSG
ncbi:OPT family oligopeptide transporter [Polyangium aurulentum]|uniref:OPT family oligopeptide transporter n=1 Tax=Polyangium aurulentum TaxID=2567896 RepID=UPI00146E3CED|nr:OPT family oligopeptide transporter [Polyangium aurulentum]UQA57356.1 OPT/YSL family transporter [Polyangium aurulentum]